MINTNYFLIAAVCLTFVSCRPAEQADSANQFCGNNFCLEYRYDWTIEAHSPTEDFVVYEIEFAGLPTVSDELADRFELTVYEGNARSLNMDEPGSRLLECQVDNISIVYVEAFDGSEIDSWQLLVRIPDINWPNILHIRSENRPLVLPENFQEQGASMTVLGRDLGDLLCGEQ